MALIYHTRLLHKLNQLTALAIPHSNDSNDVCTLCNTMAIYIQAYTHHLKYELTNDKITYTIITSVLETYEALLSAWATHLYHCSQANILIDELGRVIVRLLSYQQLNQSSSVVDSQINTHNNIAKKSKHDWPRLSKL